MAFCDLFKEFIPIRVDENRKPCDWNEEREIRVQQSRIKGFDGKREYSWVITYQEKVIGQIQLFHIFNYNTCAEVGYFIKKSYWNRGINTKALKAVCRFGIEAMGLERIEAFAHVDHISANRTLQKAGFMKEGRLRKRFEEGNCLIAMYIRL